MSVPQATVTPISLPIRIEIGMPSVRERDVWLGTTCGRSLHSHTSQAP